MLLRPIFILLSGFLGWYLIPGIDNSTGFNLLGLFVGLLTGAMVLAVEYSLKDVSSRLIFGGIIGLALGLGVTGLLGWVTAPLFTHNLDSLLPWRLIFLLTLGYLGLVTGQKLAKEFGSGKTDSQLPDSGSATDKILDTSVIIDGRIADLCETGFLEGTFILPQFILQELQHIADSSDSMKRARGRRGLDILHRIQKMTDIDVRVVDQDFPQIRDVDSKIVALAKKRSAKLVTNDLNLNKVAELQGVRVLNINQLCNALKPVVLPGELLKVFILKEGKEAGQGVAYLDDGTMIVVDEARRYIGKNMDVIVTSVLQTTAGRMIFTRLKEETEREEVHSPR
jgi:uncharacterized protein YacL